MSLLRSHESECILFSSLLKLLFTQEVWVPVTLLGNLGSMRLENTQICLKQQILIFTGGHSRS